RLSMAWAGTLLILTWLLVGVSFWILTQLGADFLPPFDEGSVQVNLSLRPGSSLPASNEVARIADGIFRGMQANDQNLSRPILTFSRRTGRAALDEHGAAVSNSEYILTINPQAGLDRQGIIKTILDELKDGIP